MFDFLKKKISSWIGKEKPKKKKKGAKKKVSKKKKLDKSKKIKAQKSEILKEEQIQKIEEKPKENFFSRLVSKISSAKLTQEQFNEIFEELEITLLENNVALEAVDKIKESLFKSLVGQEVKKQDAEKKVLESLKDSVLSVLIEPPNFIEQINSHKGVFTILFFGINGTGKTTSIAKIAHLLKKNHISCVLAAADTFRAASARTHEIWFFFRRWAIFAMLVVFPVPFMPKKSIVKTPLCEFICSMKLGGSIRTLKTESFRLSSTFFSASCFFTSCPTRDLKRDSFILSTASRATLFSRRVISNSSKISLNCSCVSFAEDILLTRREKKFSLGFSSIF